MQVVRILLHFYLISALQASYVAVLYQSLGLFNTAFTAVTIWFNILSYAMRCTIILCTTYILCSATMSVIRIIWYRYYNSLFYQIGCVYYNFESTIPQQYINKGERMVKALIVEITNNSSFYHICTFYYDFESIQVLHTIYCVCITNIICTIPQD